MKYQLTHHSLRGGRVANQDRVIVAERSNAVLMVVADGLGGHAGGEIASEILTQVMMRAFLGVRHNLIQRPSAFLALTIVQAHNAIVGHGRQSRPPIEPRTTCVACVVQNGYAYWAHVGDSRLYLIRDGRVFKRTLDHTSVEQLRQDGLLSESELREHPHKSRLTRCVGGPNPPSVTIGEETLLQQGDRLLLCTDGVWETHDDRALARFVQTPDLEEGIEEMLLDAHRQKRERCDNISATALRWDDSKIYGAPLQGNAAVHVDQEQLWADARRWMTETRVQEKKRDLPPPPAEGERRHSIDSDIRDLEAFLRDLEPKPRDP